MIHLCILLYCIFTAAQGQSIKYALKGQKVMLRPEVSGWPDQLLWKHNGNKVVEFDGSEQQVYSPFDNRVTLNWHSAELDITDLRYEDSGEYELDVYVNKKLHRSQYNLKVIDRVPKPTISCETHNGSSSNTDGPQATLMCSVESKDPQSLMKFEWISRGNVQPGPELTILLRDKHDDEKYSCTVSNPLTLETSTFIAKDCYPDETSTIAVFVGVSLLAVIFIASMAICFCKRHNKACFAERMRENLEGHVSDGAREACFAERMRSDLEGPVSPARSEGLVQIRVDQFERNTDQILSPASPPGSGKKPAQNDEDEPLLPKPCLSPQQLDQSNMDLNPDDPDGNHCNDPDTHTEHGMETQDETSRRGYVKKLKSHYENLSPASPPGKAEDEDEETESPPAAQQSLSLSQKSSDLETNETTGEHMEGADADQVTGESAEENVQKSESSDLERRNGPTNFTSPKDKGPETTLHEQESNLPQEETSSQEDKCQEKHESDNEQEDLPLDNSQQPQSPATPDNTNDTVQEPVNAAHVDTDNDKEGKTRRDSYESEGQPDSSLAEADKDEDKGENIENEDKCDPGIKKPE